MIQIQEAEETVEAVSAMVRRLENQYIFGETNLSKYVQFSLYENVEKIDAYLNSKHISGPKDSKGRDKPFFNIVTSAVNIWYRATDIDRKNIKIKAQNSKEVLTSFIASVHLQDWMDRENFGVFLNEWGRVLARYGSAVVKFVKQNGRLIPSVTPWNRIIIDPIDFNSGPYIEILELTEAQLRNHPGYDQKAVEALCNARQARLTVGKQRKDNRNDYVRLYEVHGQLPLSLLTGLEKDAKVYVQQMHVISFVGGKKGEYQDFTLVKGREENPVMITHLIKEDGRSQSIGAVEHLFEAQWMMNHTVKSIKDQLDLASKLIFQTSDGNFVGQNALTAIETGDILIHNTNEPITQVNNGSHDITSLQAFGNQWKALSQEIVSTPDSLMGTNAPSGTAWRQVEALQNEAHSLFELMTENKGLSIEEMCRIFVIPFIKTKIANSKEIAATLDANDITKIDSIYLPQEVTKRANKQIIDHILHPDFATPGTLPAQQPDMQSIQGQVQGELAQQGDQRFFKPSDISDKTWADIFKDLEWKVKVDVTGENDDSQDAVTTLTTVLKTIASNPTILQDPNAKMVFNKILSEVGTVSPLELSTAQAPQNNQPTNRVIESMSYKDAPDDIKRQIEKQAGLQPSQPSQTTSSQPNISNPSSPPSGGKVADRKVIKK